MSKLRLVAYLPGGRTIEGPIREVTEEQKKKFFEFLKVEKIHYITIEATDGEYILRGNVLDNTLFKIQEFDDEYS